MCTVGVVGSADRRAARVHADDLQAGLVSGAEASCDSRRRAGRCVERTLERGEGQSVVGVGETISRGVPVDMVWARLCASRSVSAQQRRAATGSLCLEWTGVGQILPFGGEQSRMPLLRSSRDNRCCTARRARRVGVGKVMPRGRTAQGDAWTKRGRRCCEVRYKTRLPVQHSRGSIQCQRMWRRRGGQLMLRTKYTGTARGPCLYGCVASSRYQRVPVMHRAAALRTRSHEVVYLHPAISNTSPPAACLRPVSRPSPSASAAATARRIRLRINSSHLLWPDPAHRSTRG